MRSDKKIFICFWIILVVVIVVLGSWLFFRQGEESRSQLNLASVGTFGTDAVFPAEQRAQDQASIESEAPDTEYVMVQFSRFDPSFRFGGVIPRGWRVEYVPSIESLNIYDPTAGDRAGLSSQIFIRKFTASRFLTLSTVTIHSREETLLNGRDAVRYEIEKKSGVAPFPDQPPWRSERHRLIDVRFSKQSPSVFYVIAFRPSLEQQIEDTFLDSLAFHNDEKSFVSPMERASERITKKPFGLRVTPGDSPVDSERFSGYHTGADFEIFPEEAPSDVAVRSICGGFIKEVRSAKGYGGVVSQGCELSTPLSVTYGHLKFSSIAVRKGAYVTPGEVIGMLGEGGTDETDGERKHLYLGIHRGSQADIRGYIERKNELTDWIDPCSIGQVCKN